MAEKTRYWLAFWLWLLGIVLCYAGAVAAFGRVAPWPVAMSPDRAEVQWPGQIDPSWRAVVSDHGRPREWPYGTVADSPAGFAAWVAALLACAGGVWFCHTRLKRLTDN